MHFEAKNSNGDYEAIVENMLYTTTIHKIWSAAD